MVPPSALLTRFTITRPRYEIGPPFPDASLDVVCAMDLLEHVADPDRLIAEAARVLRPGRPSKTAPRASSASLFEGLPAARQLPR